MIYKAYLEQEDEGCDYTIGCARNVIDINAVDLDDAKKQLALLILKEFNSDEYKIHSAEIYEISNIYTLSINEIYEKQGNYIAEQNQILQEEQDRREYERLKLKFNQ